jgi:hypothetical protein
MTRTLSKRPDSPPGKSHGNNALRWGLTLSVLLLLITAHRLPAPVAEEPETPAPALEQAPKPKWKRSVRANSRATSNDNESAKPPVPSGPAKFAGNWFGTISQGLWGNLKIPLVINADGTSVKMTAGERPATLNGNTITWRSGLFNEIAWTLTPQKDGITALVTSKSGLGVNGTATFYRTQNPVASAPPPKPAATTTTPPPADVPMAKPVPDKPGYVYSPFDPNSKVVLDVRDKAHGATVRDLASGRRFIVP